MGDWNEWAKKLVFDDKKKKINEYGAFIYSGGLAGKSSDDFSLDSYKIEIDNETV